MNKVNVTILASTLFLDALASAQSQQPDAPPPSAAVENSFKQTLSESRKAFERGADDEAEKHLHRSNRNVETSLDFDMEHAAQLLRVAFACQESGDVVTAQRAGRRALACLSRAGAKARENPSALAQIRTLQGVIRERLVGDTNSANESFRAALRAKPDHTAAKAKLHRTIERIGDKNPKSTPP